MASSRRQQIALCAAAANVFMLPHATWRWQHGDVSFNDARALRSLPTQKAGSICAFSCHEFFMSQNVVQDDSHYETRSPSLSPISRCVFYVPRKCERFFQDSFGAATRVFNKQLGELAAWLEFPVTKIENLATLKAAECAMSWTRLQFFFFGLSGT